MKKIKDLKIKIFADGANLQNMLNLNKKDFIKGFTTNPSLMKKAGVKDYKEFALKILNAIKDKPISFEVFADEFDQMESQALEINSWGKNANVKIPITNTKGESSSNLIKKLSDKGVKCNVTAIFTLKQLSEVLNVINPSTPTILSVFAGRVADMGVDPKELISKSVELAKNKSKVEILWASTREVLNIFQAEETGCQIITVPDTILKKIENISDDYEKNSIDTVTMFYKDAKTAGYKIK
tara:strand:+ start:1694 stop:2413 length:720 start_codon:yes stop_codon:yes gene_type:complete